MELRETLEAVKAYCEKHDACDCPARNGRHECCVAIGDGHRVVPSNWDVDVLVDVIEQIVKHDK